ncbi:MAG: PPOX class F420-dependent oxidoreductase [Actinomycetota bacterium]|nr:PPOX class F420-dependent oxidoreductase [Actinomycetota bacterium]
MASLSDPGVQALLAGPRPNHAVVSTLNEDGSIHSTVVWVSVEDGRLAVNSAGGPQVADQPRAQPRHRRARLRRDQPLRLRGGAGTARGTTEGADDHIDRLAQRYLGVDSYPLRTPDEQRIMYVVDASLVRHQKQG